MRRKKTTNDTIDTIPAEIEIDKKIDMSDVFRLYYKHDLSYREIGEKYNTSAQNIQQRLSRFTSVLPTREEISTYRQNKSQILEAVELRLIDNLVDADKLKQASLNNVAYAFQQVATQNRLEKGLATERIDCISITASLSDLERRKQELLQKIKLDIQDVVPATDSAVRL